MNQLYVKLKDINSFAKVYDDALQEIYKKIHQVIRGKREIMYSDIINLVVRNQYKGDIYNKIIIWCNYNIKKGNLFVKTS